MSKDDEANGNSSQRKTARLEVRLNSKEEAAFKRASGLAGVPVSSWARERLRWAATRELEDARLPVPFLDNPE